LKPANVIVTREGVVKVLDFGLAKLVAEETDDTGETLTTASGSGVLTRPGVVTGTAGYMSPEQATGGRVDARSDVFGFGAVLYEMVTGRRAFVGKTVARTRHSSPTDRGSGRARPAGRGTAADSPSIPSGTTASGTSGRSAPTVEQLSASRRTRLTTTCPAGLTTAASSTSAPIARARSPSGAFRPQAARKSR
jgi:serine/threonine protein kinase